MYIINHFLDIDIGGGILISDPGDAPTTNGVPSYVPFPRLLHTAITCDRDAQLMFLM